MAANVLTIPAGAPFAQTLALGLIARLKPDDDPLALSRATIYLPTRRAARNFAEVFARMQGGAVLLPEMKPLGDVDEDEFLFDTGSEDISLAPAIAPVRRRLLLARLVKQFRARDDDFTFAQAASLAGGLAKFLDDAQTQNADLSRLKDIVPEQFADHWRDVWKFLDILSDNWPKVLQQEKALDFAARRNDVLAALARRLAKNPPIGSVIAAGSTGSIPATAELLRVIANLPNGAVVLPGLDRELDDASWNDLDESHPQYGMRELLRGIGVARKDVGDWQPVAAGNPAREFVLREALRPAPTTDAWRAIAENDTGEIAKGLSGLSVLKAASPGEEAASIALILREVLQTKDKTAALVTLDRNLARRVAAEMRRWDIQIDDSAGRPLANTPPGTFLCLLAEAADEKFTPVPLLALLKHPLASGGQNTSAFRAQVRQLDLALRGPRPNPGLDGIARAVAAERKALMPWFARVADILRPFEVAMSPSMVSLSAALEQHIAVAEALAATDEEAGDAILWAGDAGNMASKLAGDLESAAAGIPDIESNSYPVLFRALAEERPVRPVFGRHPRLAILGPLEARLQSFDTIVLGGLNEGTWPRAAPADPWLSRPMRKTLGLEQPERGIGLSAHDFAMLAAGPRVILTRAQKADGSPTIASRWLQRLEQLARGLGLETKLAPEQDYTGWARKLDAPDHPPQAVKRPAPTPPVAVRPRRLSVTEIEKWLRDPYWIYAKHILRLKPLDPLDDEVGPLERGTAIHDALETFLKEYPGALPPDAEARLVAIADDVFAKAAVPHAALALWRPRFDNAAHWFVGQERARKETIQKSHLEIEGTRTFMGPAGEFFLRCRADRIDVLKSGGVAVIDYKTGNVPSPKQVETLLQPQLPLEAAILKAGGFADTGPLTATELLYIRFSGGREPGKTIPVGGDVPALVDEAEQRLNARIEDFDRQEKPYHAQVAPVTARQTSDYEHLERVREWLAGGWESGE